MKKIVFFLASLLWSSSGMAQDAYEKQLKSLADQMSQKIKPSDKKRVAVASFVDLQGNITELGKFLAEEFGIYLADNQLEVVDRSEIDRLIKENNLPRTGLPNPEQALKLGKVSGTQIIVTGTVTPLDNSVRLILKAIDLEKALQIGGSIGSIQRTEAINDLLRSQVAEGTPGNSAHNTPYIPDKVKINQDPSEILIGEKVLDIPKGQCASGGSLYGQVYFENALKQDLVLYELSCCSHTLVKITAGSRNASQLLYVSSEMGGAKEYTFRFHTSEEEESSRRYGAMSVTLKACKAIVRVINSNNMYLQKKR